MNRNNIKVYKNTGTERKRERERERESSNNIELYKEIDSERLNKSTYVPKDTVLTRITKERNMIRRQYIKWRVTYVRNSYMQKDQKEHTEI